MNEFDVIVVGGGSSGCVVASRLSEDPGTRVLLIESGADYLPGHEPADIRDVFYTAAYVQRNLWSDTRVSWLGDGSELESVHPKFYEQARVMGGGSSVNAMVALRGHELDFKEWVALGARGWSWSEVLPFYRKLERDLDFSTEAHGDDGPIPVRRHQRAHWAGFVNAVTNVLEQRGFRYIDDVNAGDRDGYGRIPMSSLETNRVSAAMGYLAEPVRRRPNLMLLADSDVTRLVFSGQRVTAVEVRTGARVKTLTTDRVVLCAGSYRTPALMLRSGVGPGEHLRSLGIPVVSALAGVGRNLHDHPTFAAAAYLRAPAAQSAALRAHASAGLFFDSGVADCPVLDMYMPITAKVAWHPVGCRIGGLFMVLMKPFSRGQVTLSTPDDRAAPRVDVNAFSDRRDLERVKRAMRFAGELLSSAEVRAVTHNCFGATFSERVHALNTVSTGNWLRSAAAEVLLDGPALLRDWLMRTLVCPGAELDALLADDQTLERWLRENITGFFHPVGTCRMGAEDDPMSVVTPTGQVRGIDGLYVADASVMPAIVRATTNLTAIMIGEKMAHHIKARH